MKITRRIALCLLVLAFSCLCSCGKDDKEETTVAIRDSIRVDDMLIQHIQQNCLSLLMEEEMYSAAKNAGVKVYVSGDGTIRVEGLGNKGNDFINLLTNSVKQDGSSVQPFVSDVYRTGDPTILEFTFDYTVYAWSYTIYNHIDGSMYYRAQ